MKNWNIKHDGYTTVMYALTDASKNYTDDPAEATHVEVVQRFGNGYSIEKQFAFPSQEWELKNYCWALNRAVEYGERKRALAIRNALNTLVGV